MARRSATDQERSALFREAIDLGFTTLDTAPLYGFGDAERQIAVAMQGVPRQSIQILTKAGLRWDSDDACPVHFEFTDSHGARKVVRRNSRPKSLRIEVERSLQRLSTDRLDLVQLHFRDTTTPIADSIGALLRLREEGKLQYIGVCNFSTSELDETLAALGTVPLASVQEKYNLLQRGVEKGVLAWCRKHSVPFLAYSPLAEGLLADKNRHSARPEIGRVQGFISEVLIPAANQVELAPATLALSWLIHQSGATAAIAGASESSHLNALQIGQSSPGMDEHLRTLAEAASHVQLDEPWKAGRIRRVLRKLKKALS